MLVADDLVAVADWFEEDDHVKVNATERVVGEDAVVWYDSGCRHVIKFLILRRNTSTNMPNA